MAPINITAETDGPNISLRLTKKEGMPVQLLKEGEGAGAVVALRRVDELGYYNLRAKQLAENVRLTPPKCRAVIDHLGLTEDVECFKEFRIGKSRHGRYSPAAIGKINAALEPTRHRSHYRRSTRAADGPSRPSSPGPSTSLHTSTPSAGPDVARIMIGLLVELPREKGRIVRGSVAIEGKAVETGYPDDVVETVKANAHDLKPVEAQWGCETE